MQSDESAAQRRMRFARAVRTRQAEHRKAVELRASGWTCVPPADEVEKKIAPAESAA